MSLRQVSILIQIFILFITISCEQNNQINEEWNQLDVILAQIVEPSFPEKNYNITSYGAVGDGVTDCTDAFKNSIDECSENGGGKVVVPEGIFLTGPIHLKSNVNLFISENSIVKFSEDKIQYLPVVFTRWEGIECMNYSPLIYAYKQENIAITGKGILDGQASNENWWNWKGKEEYGWNINLENQKADRNKLFQLAEDNIPPMERVFGKDHYLRPNFIQPYKCKNILIEGITLKNSPMWFIHPVLCENVTVQGVTVEGLGPNNDGCNPESSKNVLIKGCYFKTGDDCIAIKSGRNNDGRRVNVPSENIVVQNCTMKEGHGGVVIGSEISGGAKNVFVEDCVMNSSNLDRAIRIKTNAVRGGVIESVYVRNITVGEVKEAVIKINYFYEEGENGNFLPVVKNLKFSKITSEESKYAIWIRAFESSPVENILLANCNFQNVEEESVIECVKEMEMKSILINDKEIQYRSITK